MDLFQNLQGMLGQGLSGLMNNLGGSGNTDATERATAAARESNSLQNLFGPSLLGGLAGALLGRRGGTGGLLKGALLAGGGAWLWNKYKDRIREANSDTPGYGEASTPNQQAQRLIRALAYAAKSDGRVDEQEKAAILEEVRKLNIGAQGEALVKMAMNESPDPAVIANGVANEEEALQLFTLSCAVLDIDKFMEKNYLDSLAQALKIPDDVKTDIEAKIKDGAKTGAV